MAQTGYFLLKKIQSKSLTSAPVIMLSGMDDEALVLECLKSGAQDYILKSEVSPQSLMRSIRYAQERKQVAERLKFLSLHDPLTQLANRHLFTTCVEQEINQYHERGKSTTLLYINLDHFKEINDTLGHDIGDLILQTAGKRIEEVIGRSDLVGRLGGDEFAVLLREVDNKYTVIQIAQTIIQSISKGIQVINKCILLTPSIGIAIHPENGKNTKELLQCADSAMNDAKNNGRNHYRFYSEEMHLQSLYQIELKNELLVALEEDQFELYYQPKFAVSTECISGMEALIRWKHPKRGLVSPADFIPVAEQTGLINRIGCWVIAHACKQFKIWLDQGLIASLGIKLAINISANQLKEQDICETITQLVDDTGLNKQFLEFELTESILIEDISLCSRILTDFSDTGIKIAIDDFGTGYSSFRHLLKLPLYSLKIDKSFVDGICFDKKNTQIVTAIISMAKALNLEVIAEGVEDQQQAILLKQCGCDHFQGFFFSKPLPVSEMTHLLRHIKTCP